MRFMIVLLVLMLVIPITYSQMVMPNPQTLTLSNQQSGGFPKWGFNQTTTIYMQTQSSSQIKLATTPIKLNNATKSPDGKENMEMLLSDIIGGMDHAAR